jgi:type IV pilus assembly protein PilZ
MGERRKGDAERPADGVSTSGDVDVGPVSSCRAPDSAQPRGIERRSSERYDVTWSVDCETEDTFLYAAIANISELGIFVRTVEPLPVGTKLTLRFAPPNIVEPFVLHGMVQWVNTYRPLRDNPNPGMGIRFVDLTPADRERLVETVRTIAYLRGAIEPSPPPSSQN